MKKIFKKNTNLNWLLANRFIVMPFEIIVGVMMARYLGPENLGKLTYAINVTTILSIVTTFGLDNVIVKMIVNKNDDTEALLGTALVFRLATSFVLIFLSIIYGFIIVDDVSLRLMIFIVACGYIFQSFKIIDFYFQAYSKCKYTVISQKIALLLGYMMKLFGVLKQLHLTAFAVITFLIDVIQAVFNIIFFQKYNSENISLKKFKPKLDIAKYLFATCWPLALSSLAVHIYSRFDQVLLKEYISSSEAGLYAASGRILSLWYFMITAFGTAFYPKLVEAKIRSELSYRNFLQHYYIIMFWIAFGIALFLTLTGEFFIILLYGEVYRGSVLPLQISAWSLLPTFLGTAISQYLITDNLTKIVMYQSIIGSIVSIGMNVVLIPRFGAPGAAFSLVVVFIFTTFSYLLFPVTWKNAPLLINIFRPSEIRNSIKRILS